MQASIRNAREMEVCDEKRFACDGRLYAGEEMGSTATRRDGAKKRKLMISTNSENHWNAGLVINNWDGCSQSGTNVPVAVTNG